MKNACSGYDHWVTPQSNGKDRRVRILRHVCNNCGDVVALPSNMRPLPVCAECLARFES